MRRTACDQFGSRNALEPIWFKKPLLEAKYEFRCDDGRWHKLGIALGARQLRLQDLVLACSVAPGD